MKWLFVSAAAALSLAAATPGLAAAQAGSGSPAAHSNVLHGANALQLAQRDRDRDRDKDRDRSGSDRKPTRNLQGTGLRDFRNRDQNQNRNQTQSRDQYQSRDRDRSSYRGRDRDRNNWGDYRQGHRPPQWEQHRNFDRRSYERNFRAERRYRWHNYQRPQGWYYRRWAFGMILPSFFWTRDYWISDYWMFGLMAPPYGYVWVRYGDDAVLVDVESGYILRVVYGVFY